MPARAQIPSPTSSSSTRRHPRSDLAAANYPQTAPPPMASAHAPVLSPALHSPEEKRREETHVDRTTRSSGGQIHPPRLPRARAPPTTWPCPCVKGLDGDASAPQWPWSFLPIQSLGLDGDGCSSKGTMMNFTDDAPVKKSSVLLTRMESITAYKNKRGQPRLELQNNLTLQCLLMTCVPLSNGHAMLAATVRYYRMINYKLNVQTRKRGFTWSVLRDNNLRKG
ncbi:uncharacterized protein [Triticum aestivum]|uniref:uncharacterized protein isoform X4 n=1 Tax=Triticum aestivum TaxID=4565 RepID=UPI001D00BDBD|nr:uncharacterized protein LOC123173743 isoform X4 [Triticum aestivum]